MLFLKKYLSNMVLTSSGLVFGALPLAIDGVTMYSVLILSASIYYFAYLYDH